MSPNPAAHFSIADVRCPNCMRLIPVPIAERYKMPVHRVACRACQFQFAFQVGFLSPAPVKPVPNSVVVDTADLTSADDDTGDDSTQAEIEDAIDLCDSILGKLDDLPSRAEDFGESIREKVESIREWIEGNLAVTPKQLEALENMNSGVDRWLERSR